MTRALAPRATAALAAQPALVSDRTAPLVCGLEPRVFRELVARERIPAVRVGHRLLVRLDDLLRAFDRLAGRTAPECAEGDESEAQTAGTGVDRVLALVGRTRRGRP